MEERHNNDNGAAAMAAIHLHPLSEESSRLQQQRAFFSPAAEAKAFLASTSSSGTPSSCTTSSDEASDIAIAERDDGDDELEATPGHLHALANRMAGPPRLLPKVHSDGKLAELQKRKQLLRQRRRGSSSAATNASVNSFGAAEASPFGSSSTTSTASSSHHSNNSSYQNIDPDLLLDRLGFIDLDPPLPHEIRCGPLASGSSSSPSNVVLDGIKNNTTIMTSSCAGHGGGLTSVNERLCDETMEDCHAFQDLGSFFDYKNDYSHGHCSSGGDVPSMTQSSLSGGFTTSSSSHHHRDGVGNPFGLGGGDNVSVGSWMSMSSWGSFTNGNKGCGSGSGGGGGGHSREGSLAGGSLLGDGETSVLLGTLDEVGEEESVESGG